MLDEFEVIHGGSHYPGLITGKPAGMAGRSDAPKPPGTVSCRTPRSAQGPRDQAGGTTASVEGFGNVAQHAFQLSLADRRQGDRGLLVEPGRSAAYTYRKTSAIGFDELLSITDHFGGIDTPKARDLGYEVSPGTHGSNRTSTSSFPQPSRTRFARTTWSASANASASSRKGRTGRRRRSGRDPKKRGIFVIPDFLANAGGVDLQLLRAGAEQHELLLGAR